MKTKLLLIALTLLTLPVLNFQLSIALAQGTAFTYQGRLNSGSAPANGIYDLRFTIYDSTNNPGIVIAGPLTNLTTVVSNGLFTVPLDFGNVFDGKGRWLEIAVRTSDSGSFNRLKPRQPVTPTPYAITAENLAGAITVQSNTNGAPNIVGGSALNYVAGGVVGATIAGGGAANFLGVSCSNGVTADFGTVSGGFDNSASGSEATIGGGYDNAASGYRSTVSGGEGNTASGFFATVPGGIFNTASGDESFAAGSEANAINAGSFVWSSGGTSFSSTADFQFAVHADGGIRLVGDVTTGDIFLSEGAAAYHHIQLSGGNSLGFIYGSYPKYPDFISMGYNYYADANGSDHFINSGGGISRVSVGYGEVIIAVGNLGSSFTTMLDATATGVTVYGSFVEASDRNVKQDFASVSSAKLLEKVLQLPVSEWSYKVDPSTRHVGPMAQDFHSIFSLGTDDKHIAPIDEGGIAFAAIQGLNQKVEDQLKSKDTEIQDLKQQNDALAKRLDVLELALKSIAQAK